MEEELTFKKQLILQTAEEIVAFLDKKYCVRVDEYEIAEFINLNLRSYIFVDEESTEDDDYEDNNQ